MKINVSVSGYRIAIGALIFWAYLGNGINFQAIPPVLPLISDHYRISYTMAGLLVGAVMIVQALFCIPGAFIVGRFGLKRSYTIGWFMMGMLTLSALSPDYYGLLALRVVYALGTALLLPATGPLIMQWFRPRERTIMSSLNSIATSLGFMLAMATGAPLAEVLGWQRVLGLFGAIGLSGALVWLVWGKVNEPAGSGPTSIAWGEVWDVLTNRTLLLLGIAHALALAQYIGLLGWLPTFYSDDRDISLTQAGFMTSIPSIAAVFGVLLGGFLPLKIRSKRLLFIIPGFLLGLGGLGCYLIDNSTITYASLLVLGFGSWMYFPMLFILPMELEGMTPQKVGIAWGWFISVSGVSQFVAPLTIGAMRDTLDSFIPGFILFSVLAWSLFVVGFMVLKPGPEAAQLPRASASTGLEQE